MSIDIGCEHKWVLIDTEKTLDSRGISYSAIFICEYCGKLKVVKEQQ